MSKTWHQFRVIHIYTIPQLISNRRRRRDDVLYRPKNRVTKWKQIATPCTLHRRRSVADYAALLTTNSRNFPRVKSEPCYNACVCNVPLEFIMTKQKDAEIRRILLPWSCNAQNEDVTFVLASFKASRLGWRRMCLCFYASLFSTWADFRITLTDDGLHFKDRRCIFWHAEYT